MLVKEKYAGALTPGTHASTFGGNALACAAGLAVLRIFDEEDVLANVKARGSELSEQCAAIVRRYPSLAVLARGRGLLQGIVLAQGVDPARALTKVRERGVLATLAGGNVLRICPALTITARELEEGMQQVDAAFADLAKEQTP
jgi:acetylornithine/succinyldiaminopimelate/putrescine aminotransferase